MVRHDVLSVNMRSGKIACVHLCIWYVDTFLSNMPYGFIFQGALWDMEFAVKSKDWRSFVYKLEMAKRYRAGMLEKIYLVSSLSNDRVCSIWNYLTLEDMQKTQIKRLYLLLTIKDSAANVPKNIEARRRLQFFTNSLFMDLPAPKPVREMLSFRLYFFSALIVGINAYLMDLVFSWCLYACAVCSLHIILRLFFIAWMNFKRKMRMEYRLCFTSRKYIQVLRVLCCDD